METPEQIAAVVRAAATGDDQAWNALVDRFSGLVWSVARAHRLSSADAADVAQTTWLRLVEHLDRLRQPEHVGSWLATTARRECLRVLRLAGRQEPVGDQAEPAAADSVEVSPELAALAAERSALLRQSLQELSPRCQRLLRVLMADPAPSYQQVSAALDMPVGSIGPTRARCLDCLRRRLQADRSGAERSPVAQVAKR
ncbi:MAG: sigma-70 family RNA polymerase sigma factor [Actinomycetota bacterium]|nr:sigma-70 family RNA polymerase sigma factor [Actinomycetota bacterium]